MSLQGASLSADEYEKIKKSVHAEFWPMVAPEGEPVSDRIRWHWKNGENLETTGMVLKADHPKYGVIWRCDAILPLSMDHYKKAFYDQVNVHWIKGLATYEVIERSGDGKWSVSWNISNIGFGMADRDFINLMIHERFDDGSLYDMIVAYPKQHPKDPKNPKLVRGEYFPCGTLVRPIKGSPDKCSYTFINNFTLKGIVPMKIVNMFSSGFILDYSKALLAECERIKSS